MNNIFRKNILFSIKKTLTFIQILILIIFIFYYFWLFFIYDPKRVRYSEGLEMITISFFYFPAIIVWILGALQIAKYYLNKKLQTQNLEKTTAKPKSNKKIILLAILISLTLISSFILFSYNKNKEEEIKLPYKRIIPNENASKYDFAIQKKIFI